MSPEQKAAAYTEAWNSKDGARVAGHHAETGNFCKVSGWEEWDLDAGMQVTASRGWFDAEDYQRQVDGA